MAVTIKSKKEIELMREAGKMLEEVHNKLADFVKPGTIMDIRHPSVYLSMTKSYMVFQAKTGFYRMETL